MFAFRDLPCVAEWTRVGLPELSRLTRAMVSTSPRNSDSLDASTISTCPLVIGLVGTLGAGKTRFCQELAVSLGASLGDVTSPTFTLHRTYELVDDPVGGIERWHHLDLYRVADEDELWELGIEELWEQSDAWTLMEWADRFAEFMPGETVWIEMSISETGPTDTRNIRCYCQDPNWTRWLRRVDAQMRSFDE